MLGVPTGFTAEEKDPVRKIVGSVQVSWKKQLNSAARLFTIGVSAIGGVDTIASAGEITSDWNQYYYFDESTNLLGMNYERKLNQPIGGITQAVAEVNLGNISGRYTPRYMGGNSELFTALLPRRPIILNAGFNYNGVDQMIPQFVGVTTKNPETALRDHKTKLEAADFVNFLSNRFVDNETMFTGLRSDQVIETILSRLGFATAQYNLDPGINVIPFGLFKKGQKFSEIINQITQAEYANFYQDEEGKLRFENRQHWDSSPYTQVQRVLSTSMVIDAKAPNLDHIINVVEVKAKPRAKQPNQLVWKLSSSIEVAASSTITQFIEFDDPMLSVDAPVFVGNTQSDGNGTDATSSLSVGIYAFTTSAKLTITNSSSSPVFITAMTLYGRPAKVINDIYYRQEDDSSVTAYEERPYVIENDYIQSESWAESFAQMILNDYAEPENLQEVTIRAIPELQMGDLISWQGRYWRIFGIKSRIDPSVGFVQDLTMLQRTINQYFRIGISTIGSSTDVIAP